MGPRRLTQRAIAVSKRKLKRLRSPKVFVIGRNKTGTASLRHVLSSLGYTINDEIAGGLLIHEWAQRDFTNVLALCRTADAFADNPFGLPYTYQAVDAAFPRSKFILTVRKDGQEWYESLVRFHAKILGIGERLPTVADLREFDYCYKGWLLDKEKLVYGVDDEHLYDREHYIAHYEAHNAAVIEYFRHREDALLVLRVSDADAMTRLYEFLDVRADAVPAMPHLNASA